MATNWQSGQVNAAYQPGASYGGWSGGWNPSGTYGPTAYGKTSATPSYTPGQVNAGGMPMNAIMYNGQMNPAWAIAPSGYTGVTTNFEGNKYAPQVDILSQLYKNQSDAAKTSSQIPSQITAIQQQQQAQQQTLADYLTRMTQMQNAINSLRALQFPGSNVPQFQPSPFLQNLIGGGGGAPTQLGGSPMTQFPQAQQALSMLPAVQWLSNLMGGGTY